MRGFWLLLAALTLPVLMVTTVEADASAKTPLDLPAKGLAVDEDDEDAPETITFYGQELEGDGFMFCFPCYSFCGQLETFISITEEVGQAVNQISARTRFSLVAYNHATYVWEWKLQRGTMGNKASANAWMNTLTTSGSECLLDAGLTSLQIMNQDRRVRKGVLVCLGGNKPSCAAGGADYPEQCLTEITGANTKGHRIDTVYIDDVYVGQEQFWQDLAAANGGRCTIK